MKPHVHPRKWLVRTALLVALVWGWRHLNQWGFRRELPRSATEIHEWYKTFGILPDYSYFLKARITEDEFKKYAHAFELTPLSREQIDGDGSFLWRVRLASHLEWWNPSERGEGTHEFHRGDTSIWAKHEDGWLYLYSYNH